VHSSNWKEYLKLYNDSIGKIIENQAGYIDSLKKYQQLIPALDSYKKQWRRDEYDYYIDRMSNECDKTSSLLKQFKITDSHFDNVFKLITKKFKSKMIEHEKRNSKKYKSFGKSEDMDKDKLIEESVLLSQINEQRKKILKEVKKISSEYKDIKKQIADFGGELTGRSKMRNIHVTKTKDSPIMILIQLRASLRHNNQLPKYNDKDLLDMSPKTLDIKIENSMKKVINTKWDNRYDRDSKFTSRIRESGQDIKKELENIDAEAASDQKVLIENIKFWKKNKDLEKCIDKIKNTQNDIKKYAEDVNEKNTKFKGNDELLIEFYATILGFQSSLGLEFALFRSIYKFLQDLSKKNINSVVGAVEDQNSQLKEILEFALKALSIVTSVLPLIGTAASKLCNTAAKIIEEVNNVATTAKECLEKTQEGINVIAKVGLIDKRHAKSK